MISFSDPVGLWVIKIQMILCARSTSRSRERSTKRGSGLFYSKNNKIAWFSNMADKFTMCARVYGLFLRGLHISGADWLARQTLITWQIQHIHLIVSAGKSKKVPVVLFYIYVQMRRQILKCHFLQRGYYTEARSFIFEWQDSQVR